MCIHDNKVLSIKLFKTFTIYFYMHLHSVSTGTWIHPTWLTRVGNLSVFKAWLSEDTFLKMCINFFLFVIYKIKYCIPACKFKGRRYDRMP